jgi:hypothetical protein
MQDWLWWLEMQDWLWWLEMQDWLWWLEMQDWLWWRRRCRLRSGFPSRLQTVAESGPSRDRQGAIGYVAS